MTNTAQQLRIDTEYPHNAQANPEAVEDLSAHVFFLICPPSKHILIQSLCCVALICNQHVQNALMQKK